MPVPVSARQIRARRIRTAGVAVALTLVTGCGSSGSAAPPLVTTLVPGQPAGTVTVDAGADVTRAVQQVKDAIIAAGGTVTAVVDHAAAAKAAGVDIPPSAVVFGISAAAALPLLRVDQRAGANLPGRYLVRLAGPGDVALTYDGADYVAAVSGVTAREAREALRAVDTAVVGRAAPAAAPATPAPLIGVTPAQYLLSVFGSAAVDVTVGRLRRGADRGTSRSVADVDLAAGSPAAPAPAIRPTSVVLVSTPAVEAPLLAAAPSIGLDLPLRFVVWLDDQNRTQIGYPDVRRIAARHGIAAEDPNVARLATEADRLARLAAGIGN